MTEITEEKKVKRKPSIPMEKWKDKRWRNREHIAKRKEGKKRGPKVKRGRKLKLLTETNKYNTVKSSLIRDCNKVPIYIWLISGDRKTKKSIQYVRTIPNITGLVEWLSTVGIHRSYQAVRNAVIKFDDQLCDIMLGYYGYIFTRNIELINHLQQLEANNAELVAQKNIANGKRKNSKLKF